MGDLHLKLSEKYMNYKNLSERCVINPQHIGKGEKRVFYLKPHSPFLQEPRQQNQFRLEFLKQVGKPPMPENLTLTADDFQKNFVELIMDKSNPDVTKKELYNYFKRRQYKLQHKRYKLLARWSHYCLTSDIVDQVSLKFNSTYTKIQFEMENCIKRCQRLDGDDHFTHPDKLPKEDLGSYEGYEDKPATSALRPDDIEIYLRCVTYEEKIQQLAQRFIQKTKWTHMTKRFEIYKDSIEEFQNLRNQSIQSQELYIQQIQTKGRSIVDIRKLGDRGIDEIEIIADSQNLRKLRKKLKNARDQIMSTAKYNYDVPPYIVWNEIELKMQLHDISTRHGKAGNMDIDQGHSFSYSILVYFPSQFVDQITKNQFAPYDGVPLLTKNPLAEDLKKVIIRNKKKYGNLSSEPPLIEEFQYLDSIEKSLFGDFNNGQINNFPAIRLKKSDWLEFVCFQAKLDNEQMHQAGILSSDKNWVDECLVKMIELINIHDVSSVNYMIESLAKVHHDQVNYGNIVTNCLDQKHSNFDQFYSEDQKKFLKLFTACFRSKFEIEKHNKLKLRLQEIPQHLIFAHYLLECLDAREYKTKLLYTLNAFRSIQRRITYELREMGTRDRIMGAVEFLGPDNTKNGSEEKEEVPEYQSTQPDVMTDHLVDINHYRYKNKFTHIMQSTCPLIPKFHATFGQPIERVEMSAEREHLVTANLKKDEGMKLLGRQDLIYRNKATGLILVKDDFGVHIFYDSAFEDMKQIEKEIAKICSFYINKVETILDKGDSNKTMYFTVDRLKILTEVLKYESMFQEAKFDLIQTYVECYEHSTDILDQQVLIQLIVDEMAKRPRLNLNGTYFKDSYHQDIECFKEKTKLVRYLIKQLIDKEFETNNSIREYIEKTYRLLHEQMEKQWTYTKPENLEDELNKREMVQTGQPGIRDDKVEMLKNPDGSANPRTDEQIKQKQEQVTKDANNIFHTKHGDPKEFANYLGMPYQSLKMLMKNHHDRDPSIRQEIHEHVSFIKIQEGYPQFIYKCKQVQNLIKFTEQSEKIGLLDFYESVGVMPRVIAAIQSSINQLSEAHQPDNGLMASCLELSALKVLNQQLKELDNDESAHFGVSEKGLEHISDNEILGTSDKMLFYSKELFASVEDERSSHNPFVISKLDMQTIRKFNFENYQGYIDMQDTGMKDHEQDEAKRRLKINKKNAGRFFPKLRERSQEISIPSMLILTCNIVETLRLRSILLSACDQISQLEQLYQKQNYLMSKEGHIYFKDKFKFENNINGVSPNFVNFVEDGPASDIEMKLSIDEFDQKLRSSLNFQDPECFKAIILPLGLEELRAVVAYEVINLQILILGTQINQIILDNAQRQLCEIGFFEQGFTVANPTFNLFDLLQGQNLFESNLRKLPQKEKSTITKYISADISDGFYNILEKKRALREHLESQFKNFRQEAMELKREELRDEYSLTKILKDEKFEVKQRMIRTYKIILCHDYCKDILARICVDSLKLDILHETNSLRKRSYLMPRESSVFELGMPQTGEHQFAAYSEDRRIGPFMEKGEIKNFFRIPQFKEIMCQTSEIEKFKILNNLRIMETHDQKRIKDLLHNNYSIENVRAQQYSFTHIAFDEMRTDRLVEFNEAFDYQETSQFYLLKYFKNLSNIYDLEFFQNKIQSNAFMICKLEKSVLSGISFWDDSNDILDSENEEEGSQEDKFPEEGHLPFLNILAQSAAEVIAKEKKQKLHLIGDLENISDSFSHIKVVMKRQELSKNIQRAAKFLEQIHHIKFYQILQGLYQIQDQFLSKQEGQKDIDFINHVIQDLSHQQDMKLTHPNGFHVNQVVTDINRQRIEGNCFNYDYDAFFKAVQPIIDEEALNPYEFNIISGIYLLKCTNQLSFKKSLPFAGFRMPRDYYFLDYSLTNLNHEVRKYISQIFISIEMNLKNYIRAKTGMIEEEFSSNPSLYQTMIDDKLQFLRMNLKARQLKRIYMIILNKQTLSLEISAFNKMYQEYEEKTKWKILQENNRNIKQRQKASNPGGKKSQVSSEIQNYDLACSEVDVIQNEIQRYMINTAIKMFESESNALVKAFEMSDIRMQAFIHPVQQFASTLYQEEDSRNHLEIINKLGPMQKMLTQLRNRGLSITTLTSGAGVVISTKDLYEILEDCCRGLCKSGEIEMKSRTEFLCMMISQLQHQLYTKDRQIVNLEHKLQSAQDEVQKIINIKVFAKGNDLIYEMDTSTRQLRMIKDHLYQLETKLTEKIKSCYERDIHEKTLKINNMQNQFKQYQEDIQAQINARVREEVNTIDGTMRTKATHYKDLSRLTKQQKQMLEQQQQEDPKVIKNNTTYNIQNLIIQQDDSKNKQFQDRNLIEEIEKLKVHEKEAREELIKVYEFFRKRRMLTKFRDVCKEENHQKEIAHLKEQLTQNTTLWDQLAESQKREDILKEEVNKAHLEIALQSKVIEKLRDELRVEQRERLKLFQFKSNKSKRLGELETKAREFEVLQSVNLSKILALLEKKDNQVKELERQDQVSSSLVEQIKKQNEIQMQKVLSRALNETKYKNDAFEKLESLRKELEIQGAASQSQEADNDSQDDQITFWKEQSIGLFEISKYLKQENEKLQIQMSIFSNSASKDIAIEQNSFDAMNSIIKGMSPVKNTSKLDKTLSSLQNTLNDQKIREYRSQDQRVFPKNIHPEKSFIINTQNSKRQQLPIISTSQGLNKKLNQANKLSFSHEMKQAYTTNLKRQHIVLNSINSQSGPIKSRNTAESLLPTRHKFFTSKQNNIQNLTVSSTGNANVFSSLQKTSLFQNNNFKSNPYQVESNEMGYRSDVQDDKTPNNEDLDLTDSIIQDSLQHSTSVHVGLIVQPKIINPLPKTQLNIPLRRGRTSTKQSQK